MAFISILKLRCLFRLHMGEGYGLPLFEAAYNGLPVVVPGWSGQRDFLYVKDKKGKSKPLFASVEYDLKNIQKEAVWPGVLQEDSQWAFPREASFKRRLREVRTEYSRFKRNATRLKKSLIENFTEEKIYSDFVTSVAPSLTQENRTIQEIHQQSQTIEDIKERVSYLKKSLGAVHSQSEKIEILKDSFKGKKCYVLSCGPTLTDHDEVKLKSLLKDNLVIAVKQAYDLFGEHVDFHAYNCANFKEYDYSANSPITVEASTSPWHLGPCDLKFLIRERNFNNSISQTHDFDSWTYDNQINTRPYGPGIMYESVFYLAHHLGVSEIITIGWDNKLTNSDPSKTHFYDKEGSIYDEADFIQQNKVADNPAAVNTLEHEAKITTAAIANWASWLSKEGIILKIVSSINPAPKTIERVEL